MPTLTHLPRQRRAEQFARVLDGEQTTDATLTRYALIAEALPDHLTAVVSEGLFGGAIELDDPALVVHRDHAIQR